MEASQFVIDHATLLKANVRDHMGELRVWSLRFAEYLQARKPQQTLLA